MRECRYDRAHRDARGGRGPSGPGSEEGVPAAPALSEGGLGVTCRGAGRVSAEDGILLPPLSPHHGGIMACISFSGFDWLVVNGMFFTVLLLRWNVRRY